MGCGVIPIVKLRTVRATDPVITPAKRDDVANLGASRRPNRFYPNKLEADRKGASFTHRTHMEEEATREYKE